MNTFDKITQKSDSLIALLAAQCTDLERLLSLARAESRAAEERNFEQVLEIVSERAELGARLETFQQRIAELRKFLGSDAEEVFRGQISRRAVELAALTLSQDQKTRNLLAAAREDAAAELKNLDKSQVQINVYLNEKNKGLTYSRLL